MARITITVDGKAAGLPDGCVPGLQLAVDRTNAADKTALTLLDWLALHLKELAIQDGLVAAVTQLQQQQQADAQAALDTAVKAARDQLLAALDTPE